MHHRSDIDEHSLIKGWNGTRDQTFLNNDTMAQDQSVNHSAKAPNHRIGELLLDALGLSQIDLFYKDYVLVFRRAHHLHNLRVKIVLVPYKQAQLTQVAFEEFPGNSRANSSSCSRKEHTFASKLVFKVERGQVAFCLLFNLRHNRSFTGCSIVHSKEALDSLEKSS